MNSTNASNNLNDADEWIIHMRTIVSDTEKLNSENARGHKPMWPIELTDAKKRHVSFDPLLLC